MAHGDPAAVLSVVSAESSGRPQLLRLSEGMALRNGERTRYLCPALFDSDVTPRAAALADGVTIAASSGGAYLLSANGAVEPHPDRTLRAHAFTALEASADGRVYALRSDGDRAQLLAVDAERARVLAELPPALMTLAVEDSVLLLAGRSSAGRLLQRGFAGDGSELSEWSAEASAPLDSAAAFARLAGQQPYVVVAAENGLGSELARLEPDRVYRVLQRAGSPISGPTREGTRTWFAFDGRLAELQRDEQVARREDAGLVTCVGRSGPLAYVCADNALVALRDGELAERLFGLDEIAPPDVAGLDRDMADRCTLQWLRFRVDLVAAGVTPNDDAGARDGGPAVDRDAGAVGTERDAGEGAGAKGDAGGAVGDDGSGEDGGCGCGSVGAGGARGSRGMSSWPRGALAMLLVAWCALRSRGRGARRTQ